LKVRQWIADGFPPDKPEFSDKVDFECLLIKSDGAAFLIDPECELMPVIDTAISIGTGSQYAMAAMECGLSAEQAVGVAAKFDPSTSLPVTTIKLQIKPKRAR
jgi:ATP-dependent protease HslVU (ClpYQ) peptidase subunit